MNELPTITPRREPRVEIQPRVLIGLLVAALVSSDLVIAVLAERLKLDWPSSIAATSFGYFFGQTSLLTLWLVWGQPNIALRVLLVAAGIFGIGLALNVVGSIEPHWFGGLLIFVSWQAIAGWIACGCRWQLKGEGSDPTTQHGMSKHRRQFSVWGLLSFMTATGVTLSVVQLAGIPMHQFREGIEVFGMLAAQNVLACGACLILKRAPFYVVATLVVGLADAYLLPRIFDNGPREQVACLWMCLAQSATVLACMAVLRLSGLRLKRPVPPTG